MSVATVEAVNSGTLADLLDRILDKGVVINADITVTVVGIELLELQVRLALASFETAARYGLEFPSGVNMEAPAWRALTEAKSCPRCGAHGPGEGSLASNCPACGWVAETQVRANGQVAPRDARALATAPTGRKRTDDDG